MDSTITTYKHNQLSYMASPKFSLTLAALLLLFSYSSINKETVADNSDVVIINIDDIKTLDDAKLTDLISDYAYIPLETSEEALVGQITTIAFDENRIFILDRITTVIHVFTKDGKFLHKLEAKGNGPEEFSEIESFTLNKEKNHIIIGAIGKILTFDYEGKFINAFKTISGGSAQIAYAGDGKLLIYSSLYYLDTAQGFNQAGIIDLRTKEYVTKDIPFNPKSRMENITLFYNSISYGNADVKYLSIPYKDNVWEVSGSSINAAYKIDFGENSLPENYEDDYISNSRYSSDDLRNIETKEGWERIRGGGVLFNQNMLCFNYATKGKFQL